MRLLRTLRGFRPLTFTPGGLLLARGYELFEADLECQNLRFVAQVPRALWAGAVSRVRHLARILRAGARLACRITDQSYLVSEGRRMWLLDLPSGRITLDHAVARGSRPLSVTLIEGVSGFEDGLYYGEYWENASKDPVSIWFRDRSGSWRIAHTFPKGAIEHVHALIPDRRRRWLWILAGDFGHSAGIWVAREGFREVLPLLAGKQEYRCCWLAQLAERIVYATDTPLERNSVRELRVSVAPGGLQATSLPLAAISGSSIYSCMVGDRVVFSTTVEPGLLTGNVLRDFLGRGVGPGIEGPYADLMSGDARGFTRLGRWGKDRWPSRLCEFGSISFPTGHNPGPRLYAYFTALAPVDGCMGVFELA